MGAPTFYYSYIVGLYENIIINEIMYNPSNEDANEFVELYNQGTYAIDLNGWIIGDFNDNDTLEAWEGSSTLISAGGYAVVVDRNCNLSLSGVVLTTDDYAIGDGLCNLKGDMIRLYKDSHTLVDFVVYNDSSPWPRPEDNYSIELLDPSYDNNVGSNWAISSQLGGTPGQPNVPALAEGVPALYIVSSLVILAFLLLYKDRKSGN